MLHFVKIGAIYAFNVRTVFVDQIIKRNECACIHELIDFTLRLNHIWELIASNHNTRLRLGFTNKIFNLEVNTCLLF
ncbi:hypothetical protein D3C71_1781460 [compost metagenome]